LPSDSGVTFEGFENIKLKSRESVKEKLEDFMDYCKNARKPAIRVILGEWGEGKTDACRRYIEPMAKADGNYAFLVSASTLSNGYEMPSVSELLKSTSLSAERFLVVLFNAIREECEEEKIPNPWSYRDASSYLNAVLNNLIGEKKTRRIFIFIDEFEELLLFPQRLKDIISGIKETINGMYKAIDEGGEYGGCVHLIIAATPDAYYRLQTEEDTSLIFGGLGRRAGIIDLPQIRKEEGITFLFELLKYSYRNDLPQLLPINNFGIFNVIFHIAQGNPGNLVSLFARLMNSARIDEKSINIIDYEHLLKFLGKEHVFVYGGSTACLETEAFCRFLKVVEDQRKEEIGEKCALLLRMVVGEIKPFSIDELEKHIKYGNIKNLIAIINDTLNKREGIRKAILKVSPLRSDKTFYDVEMVFKDFILEREYGKYILIDNYSEQLDIFEDRISYFTYENDNIVRKIYLPSDEQSIMSFFEGITPERAIELRNIIRKRLCGDEDYYIASDELLSQIFPTPVPRELDFIKNREKRLKIWRDVTKNLAKEYERSMPQAFIYVLNKSGIFSITEKDEVQKRDGVSASITELRKEEIKINVLFFSVNGDVRGIDIEELWRLRRERRPPIQCTLLIFTGELTPEAREKIENKEMGKEGENIILEVRIHPTLIKRIICMYRASLMPTEDVDEKILSSIANKIITYELNISGKIDSWLKEQEKRGIVVKLRIKSTSNLREFADTLKFFINFMELKETVKGIFDRNQELLKYTRYGTKKIGLIPDIQFSKLNEIVRDLLDNGFLVKSEEEKYVVQNHPVEDRILRILKEEIRISPKDLEGFFILENSRYLSDVFLPIIEYKGLVRKKDNYCLHTDKNELLSAVKEYYERFVEEIKRYQNYGYIYMVKERGERLISLVEFKLFIDNLYEQIQVMSGLNEQIELQKLSLMKRLLEHFFEELSPLLKKASGKCEEILTEVYSLQNDVENLVNKIREGCGKWFKLQFEAESIEEYKVIQEILEKIKDCSSFTDERIKKVIDELNEKERRIFSFNKNDEEAFYFNPKLYVMSTLFERATRIREEVEGAAKKLGEHFDSLEKKRKEIEFKLKSKKIDEKYKISYSILKILSQLNENILLQVQPFKMEKFKLKDLLENIQPNLRTINSNLESLERCVKSLDELYKVEEKFVKFLEENIFISSHLPSVFDIEEYSDIAKNFNNIVNGIASKYEDYSRNIQLKESSEIEKFKEVVDELKKKLVSERDLVKSKWNKCVERLENFISNIEYTLKFLQKLVSDAKKIKEVEDKLTNLRNYINVRRMEEFSLKLSELERMKRDMHNALYEALRDILTRHELLLVEYIVEKLREKKEAWLPIEEVYQFAERDSDLCLDRSRTSEILEKLLRLNILKEGIALAFTV
jgi:predicted DNA-binding ribbon-helix-helix protein